MISRWFHRPELHTPSAHSHRKVGWLELFYDLIYVATIIQLGNALSANVGVTGFLSFAGLFVPIWYGWTGFTFYSNRFVVDDLLHRGLVFVQMFCIGAMAVQIPDVFRNEPAHFAVAHAGARLVLIALYFRAWRQVAGAKEMTKRFTLGFSLGLVLWVASIFVPPPYTYLLWAVAMVNDIAVGSNRHSREIGARYPPDVPHMSERYGLLTIIVLGEGFVKVLTQVAAYQGDSASFWSMSGMATLALLITCSLWWLYFDDVAGSRIKRNRATAAYVWVYAHLPLVIAVTAVGVSLKKAVFFDPMAIEAAKYRWLLCGSLGLAFLSVAVIDSVTERRHAELADASRTRIRYASGIFIILLAPAGAFMPSWSFMLLITAACVCQVLFDLSMAPDFDPHGGHDNEPLFASASEELSEDDEERDAAHRAPVRPPRRDISEAIRVGTPDELRRDLYFHLMSSSWPSVLFMGGMAFFFINAFFAALFMLDPEGVNGLKDAAFIDALSFSVQTFTTVGYGAVTPASAYAHTLVMIEAAFGLLFVAMATGLIFAKVSRPASSVLFSKVVVVNVHHGVPTLSFRLGNARGNDIVEASLKVAALIEELSPEGHTMRRLHDLTLERDMSPLFTLSWTVFHRLDASSPLHGLTADNIDQRMGPRTCTSTPSWLTSSPSTTTAGSSSTTTTSTPPSPPTCCCRASPFRQGLRRHREPTTRPQRRRQVPRRAPRRSPGQAPGTSRDPASDRASVAKATSERAQAAPSELLPGRLPGGALGER